MGAIPVRRCCCRPAVSHPEIFDQRHVQLWTARIPLIYFGGAQDIPRPPVNIDFLHSTDGRGGDRWFPNTYQTWHSIWDAREKDVMIIPRFPIRVHQRCIYTSGFWKGKRFLSGDAAHMDSRLTQVPMEATCGVSSSPPPVSQLMTCRITGTLRDGCELVPGSPGMEEENAPSQRVCRMLETSIGRHRRGGRGGRGWGARGDGADVGGDGAGGEDDQPNRGVD
ncbi:hypothetical protein PIB30_049153 [Stylosanthes scabra]|uniref:Uncharacterized protein n=1 Tax=Stylosanthes scabra TaxID=79078 RepID=A0ABU6ZG48_9FABA|nr:hypothetical protein [Stylosanthes scabra]